MMKNMKLFAPVFAVLLLCMTVQVVRAGGYDNLIGLGRYGAALETSTVDQAVPVTFGGRYGHLRVVWRIWLEPTGANTVPVVWLTDDENSDTLKLFSLPTITDGDESTLDLISGQFVDDGAAGTVQTNLYPVGLKYGDTLSIYDSLTNAVTVFRVEYVDILQ